VTFDLHIVVVTPNFFLLGEGRKANTKEKKKKTNQVTLLRAPPSSYRVTKSASDYSSWKSSC